MNLGETIRKLRLIRGYNQKYMAAQLGISERQYSNIDFYDTTKLFLKSFL